jgi:hypothetical protein
LQALALNLLNECGVVKEPEKLVKAVPFAELRAIALRWRQDTRTKSPGSLIYRIIHRHEPGWDWQLEALTAAEYQQPFIQRYRTDAELERDAQPLVDAAAEALPLRRPVAAVESSTAPALPAAALQNNALVSCETMGEPPRPEAAVTTANQAAAPWAQPAAQATGSPLGAAKTWASVLDDVKTQMSKNDFAFNLAGTTVATVQGNTWAINATCERHAATLERYHRRRLADWLSARIGQKCAVVFRVEHKQELRS